MSGFTKNENGRGYVQFFGPYRVTAHEKHQVVKGKHYQRYYARIPSAFRRRNGKLEVERTEVYGLSLEELEIRLKNLFRLDGYEPFTWRPGLLIRDYIIEWYQTQKPIWKKRTQQDYWRLINDDIIPGLGDREVGRLTGSEVDTFLLGFEKEHSGKAGKIKTILRSMMLSACMDGLVSRNPVNTKLRKVEHKKRPFLERDQIEPFLLEAEKEGYRNYCEFLMLTGLRPAEGIGATWDHYNENQISLYVDQQYQGGEMTTTKTTNSREVWQVDVKALKNLLERQKAFQNKQKLASGTTWNNSLNLIFTDDRGNPLQYGKLAEAMRRIREKLEIKGLTLYSLRHTYATHAYSVTREIEIVQQNMGHQDRRTTMIYVGTLKEDKEEFRRRMNGYWAGCGKSDISQQSSSQ